MILVDSGIWIDFFRGASNPLTDRLVDLIQTNVVSVGDLMLVEVLQGFTNDREQADARRLMTVFPTIDIAGKEIAIQAAQNYRLLRQRGVTVRKTIDTLIATRCIVDNIPLLYSDRDFDPFVEHLGLIPCPAR
jgi:hypothetical protein